MSSNNYYGLDFDTIYLNVAGKNCTKEVKKVLDKLPVDIDFNKIEDITLKLKGTRADTTVAKDIKTLAAFIVHLNGSELAKLKITDKDFLVGKGDKGTYYAKIRLLTKSYEDKRRQDALLAAATSIQNVPIQEEKFPTFEEYDAFYERNLEKARTYLDIVDFLPEDANIFIKCFLVCFKHDLPDMRGTTLAEMMLTYQSKNFNYVIDSRAVESVIVVYNRYKTSDTYGIITEVVVKEHPLYDLFLKAIHIAKQYKVDYLFYDYVKKHEYTPAQFNSMISKAHEELGITERQIRIMDEAMDLHGVNPVADLGKMIMGRIRRGHSLLEGLQYAKRFRSY